MTTLIINQVKGTETFHYKVTTEEITKVMNSKKSILKYLINKYPTADLTREAGLWGKMVAIKPKELGEHFGYKQGCLIRQTAAYKTQLKAGVFKEVPLGTKKQGKLILVNPAYFFTGCSRSYGVALREYNQGNENTPLQNSESRRWLEAEEFELAKKELEDENQRLKAVNKELRKEHKKEIDALRAEVEELKAQFQLMNKTEQSF